MLSKKKTIMVLALSLSIFSQGLDVHAKENVKPNEAGKWLTGEYHAHTYQSDDAQQSLQELMYNGFKKYDMDWIAVSDHLRVSSKDDEGNTITGGPIPFSKGMAEFQFPKLKELEQSATYKNKIMFAGFEWDMPTYEHVGVGIIGDKAGSDKSLKAVEQFEYLFTDRDITMFNPLDIATWNAADQRAYSTKEDARKALAWLQRNYKNTSYALLNHPSRKQVYMISDIRDFNTIAPNVVFGMEGMPGNQMEPDRGGLNLDSAENRTYGGADYMIAKVGGVWDALLGEGRRFWNFANSDSHFEISDNRLYSSGYWPGQYSKNYTWVKGNDIQSVLDGMRSGKSFSVFGDLVNKLDFQVHHGKDIEDMGGELQLKKGKPIEITIRFKSPKKNNNGDAVQVNHIDLIAGDVTDKAKPGTAAYSKDTNDSTKVIKRFTSKDWKTDKDGYNVIKYRMKVTKDQYFRLRGTNLGVNVEGETRNGNPLMDVKTDIEDNETRFAEINKRNYNDLWFYSNPIFVKVTPDKKSN